MAKGNGDYHHFPNGQGLDTRRFVLPAGTYLGRRESFALAPVSEQGIAIGYHGHLRLNEWLVESGT